MCIDTSSIWLSGNWAIDRYLHGTTASSGWQRLNARKTPGTLEIAGKISPRGIHFKRSGMSTDRVLVDTVIVAMWTILQHFYGDDTFTNKCL